MQKGKKKKHYHLEENILSNAKFLRLNYWKRMANKIQNSFFRTLWRKGSVDTF